MRRRYRTTILLATTTGALGLGCGLSAWASWTASAVPVVGRATVARVPTVDQPRAEMSDGHPKITWPRPAAAPDRTFDGYVVIRRNGGSATTVCAVAATTQTCHDATAPAGTTVTYVVRATAGPTWVGPDSEASTAVRVPGTPTGPAPRPSVTATVNPGHPVPATPFPTPPTTAATTPQSPPGSPTAPPASPTAPPPADVETDPADTDVPPPPNGPPR